MNIEDYVQKEALTNGNDYFSDISSVPRGTTGIKNTYVYFNKQTR
jgi:hypothetical protein